MIFPITGRPVFPLEPVTKELPGDTEQNAEVPEPDVWGRYESRKDESEPHHTDPHRIWNLENPAGAGADCPGKL